METQSYDREKKKIRLLRTISFLLSLCFLLLLGMGAELFRAAQRLEGIAGKVERAAEDVSEAVRTLGEVKWEEIAATVTEAAKAAGEEMENAKSAMEKLDMQSLNDAVTELNSVLAPLADFFRRIG